MNKTLITAVSFAACAAMQLPAQNFKEGVISFAMTEYVQKSVSTHPTVLDAGRWSQRPRYYKTASAKLNTASVLKSISYVLYGTPSKFSSKAQLVLVQGELSGFFNMTDPGLPGATALDVGAGEFDSNGTGGITTVDQGALFVAFATGRHLEPVPAGFDTEGAWPPGHHQPWGQIFVKDPGMAGYSANDPFCLNVTYLFAITVEECYDCLYLNSFITDTTFTFKAATVSGPPCCSVPESLGGHGIDKYYMSLSFDNTYNNPYLNPNSAAWTGIYGVGVKPNAPQLPADGILPDLLAYSDTIIITPAFPPSPYEMRFTLQGIMTYRWNLKFINPGDVVADFIGSATFMARGYGFIGLFCALLDGGVNGAMGIAEGIKKATTCCQDDPWYDSWYGVGWNQVQSPWDTFGTDLGQTVPGFGSPINTPVDLSFHTSFDQNYYPGWEWGTNPTADVPQDTPLDLDHPATFVPIWSAPTLIPIPTNTDLVK